MHVRGRALHLVCTTPCTSLGTGNRVLPLLGYVLLHLHLFLATLLTYVSWMRCCRVHLPVWHVADFLTRESYDADDLESGDSVWPAVELCQPATATKSQAAAQATAVPCAHPPHPPPHPAVGHFDGTPARALAIVYRSEVGCEWFVAHAAHAQPRSWWVVLSLCVFSPPLATFSCLARVTHFHLLPPPYRQCSSAGVHFDLSWSSRGRVSPGGMLRVFLCVGFFFFV